MQSLQSFFNFLDEHRRKGNPIAGMAMLFTGTTIIPTTPFSGTTQTFTRDCHERVGTTEDLEKLYYLVLNLPQVMHGSATGSGEHFNNFSLFYGCREEPASFRQVLSENYEKIFTGKKQYQELEYIVATSEALSSTPNSCQSYNDTFVKLARHVLNYQKTKTK